MFKFKLKAFTLVELLVTIVILTILTSIGISFNNIYKEKAYNSKITTDLTVLESAFYNYKQDTKTLPQISGNLKYFTQEGDYAHDETEAYGVDGYLYDSTISKRYISVKPKDLRTNQYYSYGKTIKGLYYEISGVVSQAGNYEAIVKGNYDGLNRLSSLSGVYVYNLIREYNGPSFVFDKSRSNFPYNPDQRVMTAKISSYSGAVLVNGELFSSDIILNKELISGDNIKLSRGGEALLYFSDGSNALLGDNESETNITLANMSFAGDDNIITKIVSTLDMGTVLIKAAKMGKGSSFEIYTTDLEASVRGTIFKLSKHLGEKTDLEVIKGSVEINRFNNILYDDLVDVLSSGQDISKEPILQINLDDFFILRGDYTLTDSGGQLVSVLNTGTGVFQGLNENQDICDDENNCNSDFLTGSISNLTGSLNELVCEANQHIEDGVCVSNVKSCYVENGIGIQYWEDGVWGNCSVKQCNSGYVLNSEKLCVSETCLGIVSGTGKISNATINYGGIWHYDYNPGTCTYTCDDNYAWNGSECIAKTKEVNCEGLQLNTQWNGTGFINQTWNGFSWTPTNIGIYGESSIENKCIFNCKEGFVWDGSVCKTKCEFPYVWDSVKDKCKLTGYGCEQCPNGYKSGEEYSFCTRTFFGTFGSRYYMYCNGTNVRCGLEKEDGGNCNSIEPFNWTIYK
ncbi:MAG: FecR domain-containing protein [Candidatus Gracilibacteria bacterium]|nr:FecR domain-containing protein [Candidatus Gracilibacteria bacterium]